MSKIGWSDFVIWQCSLRQRNFRMFSGKPSEGTVALILDNSCITKWQRDALEEAQDIVDIRLILNCTNTRTKKRVIKHFFYYVLNIFTLRNHFTKRSVFKSGGVEVIPFECKYDGVWQAIPTEVSMQLKDNKVRHCYDGSSYKCSAWLK